MKRIILGGLIGGVIGYLIGAAVTKRKYAYETIAEPVDYSDLAPYKIEDHPVEMDNIISDYKNDMLEGKGTEYTKTTLPFMEKPPIMDYKSKFDENRKSKNKEEIENMKQKPVVYDYEEPKNEILYEDPEEDELEILEDGIYYTDEPDSGYRSPKEGPAEKPFGIDSGEYYDNQFFDKVSLIYFNGDDTMIYEGTHNFFDNIDEELGRRWKEEVGKYDEDVAYIRNENYAQDYCIQFLDESYIDSDGL